MRRALRSSRSGASFGDSKARRIVSSGSCWSPSFGWSQTVEAGESWASVVGTFHPGDNCDL